MRYFIHTFIGLCVYALSTTALATQTVNYIYNEAGQLVVEDGPRSDVNDISTNTYNEQGLLATVTNALGHVIAFADYDSSGNPLSIKDANGVFTEFTYHDRGWLLSSRIKHPADDALDVVTNYNYDAVGLLVSMTLPNKVQIEYEYDDSRRLIAVTRDPSERIEYQLDAAGNRLLEVIKDSSGNIRYSVNKAYDELSRVMRVLGNNDQINDQQYDVNGNPVRLTDGRNQTTERMYDALNRVKEIIDPANAETRITYNARNQIASVTDARGLVTTYEYDGFGNLLSQTSPDAGTTTFTYDAAGNRTSATDSRGVVVNYNYDALNRLISVEYPASSAENITYSYDDTSNGNYGIGRLTGISSGGNTTAYHYNHLGLVTAKQTTVNNITRTTNYAYDAAGQLMEISYPSGRKISYLRDSAGRIARVSNQTTANAAAQTLVDAITYLPFGPVASYTYGNGLNLTHHYDLDYRLRGIDVSGIHPILDREYQYDPANNITAILNKVDSTKSQVFDYDALNRLTIAEGSYGLLGYTYDAVGNQLSQHQDTGSQLINDTYTYATTSHQLLGISRTVDNQANSTRNFGYDAAGNRISGTAENGSEQTYSYNHANRMNHVAITGGTSGNTTAAYTYNPLGQRVTKTINNQTQEIYHYDEAGQLLAVTDSTGNTLREYIYLDNQQVAFISNGNLFYIHNDHLNTPQIVTDQNQQVVWMADYQPFGKLADNQTNSVELYSRFPGQYLDTETGLYYNYFRDYDPSIGRYIQSDPIGLSGGINTYLYANANPIIYADPEGLTPAHAARVGWSVGTNVGRGINWAWEAAAGQSLGNSIYDWVNGEDEVKPADGTETNCPPDKGSCPPCSPPVGTVRYEIHMVPPHKPHWPHTGSHIHYFTMHQSPSPDCRCFWKRNSLPTSELPPPKGMSPME